MCLDTPEEIATIAKPEFISEKLNETQEKAVMKALNTENIVLYKVHREREKHQ